VPFAPGDRPVYDRTLAALTAGLGEERLAEIEPLHLDRSYDYPVIERQLRALSSDDFDIHWRGTRGPGVKKRSLRLGM
jgi:hypothetical protein